MLERYTRTFMDGEAYINMSRLHTRSQGAEVCGEPIQRLAQYESTGISPIEVLGQRQKLREYMLLGSPEYIRQLLPADMDGSGERVASFRGNHEFLSNYYPVAIEFQSLTFGSLEAAFQAAKCIRESDRQKFTGLSAAEAKKQGRLVECRSNWDSTKNEIMLDLLRIKFTRCPELGDKLLATGNAELVEGNTWHDQYWGDCSCPKCRDTAGHNHLGKMLMLVRAELRERMRALTVLLPDGSAILARSSGNSMAPGISLFLLSAEGGERLIGSAQYKESASGKENMVIQAYGPGNHAREA